MEINIDDKILKFNYGNTGDVLNLIRFISRKAKNNLKGFDLNENSLKNIFNLQDFSGLLGLICDCIGDEELENIFFKLSNNCIFNNERITKNLFDDVENRKYFFKIFYNIMLENLKVFFTIKASTI